MSDTDDWQHVGKVRPKSKQEKEQALKKMPKVKDLDYATKQSLMFHYDEDFKKRPLSDRSNKQLKQPSATTDDGAKGDLKQANKKKPKKSEHKPQTIDKALKSDNLLLEKKLQQTKDSFPNDTTIWFKETVFYLNTNLNFPDEQLIPNGRPFDFPLCNIKESTAKALKNLYSKEVAKTAVPHLFNQYLIGMLDNIARDKPTWGYKLCIQAIAHSHPDLCCQELKQHETKLQTLHNVPRQCIALLWALGQTGFKNSRCGMRVWLEVMLPNLQCKSVAQFAMPYIEIILNRTNKPQETFASAVKTKEFLQIAKWSYGDISVKGSSIIRDKMKSIYPAFQDLVTGSKSMLKQTFTAILERQTSNETPLLSEELSKISVICLKKEHGCFKLWRDRYTARIIQSRILLSYMESNWEAIRTELPRKELQVTMEIFVNTNVDVESNAEALANSNEFVEIKNLCEDLNSRLKQQPVVKSTSRCRAVIWATVIAFVALAVGIVLSDVKTNGGKWHKSDTYKFLKAKGVIAVTDYLWARLQHVYQIVSSWLVTNVPYYYRTVSAILGPYFRELMSHLDSLVVLVTETSKPAVEWLHSQTGDPLFNIGEWLKIGAIHFLDYLDVCVDYTRLVAIFFYEQVEMSITSCYRLYTGEITFSDVRSAILVQMNLVFEVLMKLLQRVGNYIAPDEP